MPNPWGKYEATQDKIDDGFFWMRIDQLYLVTETLYDLKKSK